MSESTTIPFIDIITEVDPEYYNKEDWDYIFSNGTRKISQTLKDQGGNLDDD